MHFTPAKCLENPKDHEMCSYALAAHKVTTPPFVPPSCHALCHCVWNSMAWLTDKQVVFAEAISTHQEVQLPCTCILMYTYRKSQRSWQETVITVTPKLTTLRVAQGWHKKWCCLFACRKCIITHLINSMAWLTHKQVVFAKDTYTPGGPITTCILNKQKV